MKNAITAGLKIGFAVVFLLVITVGCGSSPSASKLDELDIAIRDASDYLNKNIPKGSKIAILNIQSTSPGLSEYIIDELIANAVNDRVFSVVDRQQLDKIRIEQNFQLSGEVDDNSATEIGKLLGAQTIVSGGVNRLGQGYRIRIRALEVQTAQVQGQYNRNIASSQLINAIVEGGGYGSYGGYGTPGTGTTAAASGRTAQATPTAPAVPAVPAKLAYKIGDTGPAGGLIFYDKGNNSGGWRYLEAAPVEAEFQAVWRVSTNTKVDNTQTTIGSGKRNTQLIVEKFKQTSGEWDTAAQKADALVFGGFDDWFLPSRDELDQMYGNLKRRNLGDFKNDWYWASSAQSDDAHRQDFSDGKLNTAFNSLYSTYKSYVRPIRQVPGS